MNEDFPTERDRSGFWRGTLFGALLGAGSLLTYQYLSGILRQPRLLSSVILSEEGAFETREALAMYIAAQNLTSGIHSRRLAGGLDRQVLHAGYRNFRESWARDFGFAAYGLLALEEYRAVVDTLEAFLWYQTEEGQFPVKLHSISVVTRFLYSMFGREQPTGHLLKPKYNSAHGAPSLDGQALLVIAAQNYARVASDTGFLYRVWGQLKLAMEWLEPHRVGADKVLLVQGAYADWADSIARPGRVMYTNVVYWQALRAMGQAAAYLGLKEEATRYQDQAREVADAIQALFWRPDPGYFVTSERLNQLGSAGNLLAVAWGLASTGQAESILDIIDEAGMAEPVPTRVSQPPYPSGVIALENRLGGLASYHTDAAWLWIGAWHVIALARCGRLERAQELMERMVAVIVRDGQVNEVYGPDGEPLGSFWYRSESPLTWNAGMMIYAYDLLQKQKASTPALEALLPAIGE